MSFVDEKTRKRLQREFVQSEYGKLFLEAKIEYQNGNERKGLDLFWKSFRAAPDNWSYRRCAIFTEYCGLISCVNPDKKDVKNLERVVWNKSETAFCRVFAAMTSSGVYKEKGQYSIALDYYRELLAAADGAGTEELEKRIYLDGDENASVAHKLNEIREKYVTILRAWEGVNSIVKENSTTPCLHKRALFGGSNCDYCDKSREEAAVTNFRTCSRCEQEYYCSKECQRKAWKGGHKQACRKPSQREAGDIMYLHGYDEHPALNQHLVELIKPNGDVHWIVHILSSGMNISVPSDALSHTRITKECKHSEKGN